STRMFNLIALVSLAAPAPFAIVPQDGVASSVDYATAYGNHVLIAERSAGEVELWDRATGRKVRTLSKAGWHHIAFNPKDGTLYYSGLTQAPTVLKSDLQTVSHQLPASANQGIFLSQDGTLVALAHDNDVTVFDTKSKKQLHKIAKNPNWREGTA